MVNATENINLQKITKLPIKVVLVGDKQFPDILVKTPHRGEVNIRLKKEHHPFLFGSVTQVQKHFTEVAKEVLELENEAKNYLLEKWLTNPS